MIFWIFSYLSSYASLTAGAVKRLLRGLGTIRWKDRKLVRFFAIWVWLTSFVVGGAEERGKK